MKILMVCLGNICRSPLAEGILQDKLGSKFNVDSAGTIALHQGEKPDKRSIATAENHGIDISKQKSRPIKNSDLDEFDIIYCMDKNNVKDVLSLAKTKEQKAKVHLFLEVLKDSSLTEVPDPYWGNMQDFENVYQLIDKACTIIAKDLVSI
jgi:protein-tyrosine phosphatase